MEGHKEREREQINDTINSPQFKMKLSASDLFKDKKLAYPPSVPKPFITTHLCKSNNDYTKIMI